MDESIKNQFKILTVLLLLGIAIIAFVYVIQEKPQQIININGDSERIINEDLTHGQLEWNNIVLTDHTQYNEGSNLCEGQNLGMNIKVNNCKAQDIDGANIEQYVTFNLTQNSQRNITYIFVYDGQLIDGQVYLKQNQSYNYQAHSYQNQWITNYLVSNVSSYVDMGTPDSRCQIGNINNTRMFNVTQGINKTIYCFTNITIVNATAFRISGNYNADVFTDTIGYRIVWNDITSEFQFLGNGLLGDTRSYYRVTAAKFNPYQVYETRWVYTPKDKNISGKWHILGYEEEYGFINSIQDNRYLYLDPWWNSTWNYRKQVNVSSVSAANIINYSVFYYVNQSLFTGINNTCADIRFTNDTGSEIPYWIENYTTGSFCNVWFKADRLSSSGNTSFYVYYDNDAVSTTSNIKNAFLVGDDFADGSLDTNIWESSGTVTEANNSVRLDFASWIQSKVNSSFTSGLLIKFTLKDSGSATVDQFGLAKKNDPTVNQNPGKAGVREYSTNTKYMVSELGQADIQAGGCGNNRGTFGNYYCLSNSTTLQCYSYSCNVAKTYTGTVTETNSTASFYSDGANKFITNVTMRKLNNPEPTYLTGGEESNTVTGPTVSNLINNPTNGSAYVQGATYRFNATITSATSTVDEVIFNLNGVNYSTPTNFTSNFTFTITDLGVKVHNYTWYANDSNGNWGTSGIQYYTIVKASTTTTLTTTPASPINYGTNSTFSCTNNIGSARLTFTMNGVDASGINGVSLIRGAGVYNLNCSTALNENYTGSEQTTTYTINQLASTPTLLMNGTASNLTMAYPSQLNVSASCNFGNVTILRNGTDVTGFNGVFQNLPAGYYNITMNCGNTSNYSASTKSYFANITKGTPLIAMSAAPSNTVVFGTVVTFEGLGCPSQLTCQLFRNDTTGAISNPNVTNSSVGSYFYVFNTTGNNNYTSASANMTYTVTSSPLVYPQYSGISTPANPITYVSGASYQFDITYTDAANVKLSFGNVNYTMANIGGNNYRYTFTDLSAGTYAYKFWANSSDGSVNETASVNYVINKATPTGNIARSPSGTLNYPTETTVTATESNVKDGGCTYSLFLDGSTVGVGNPDVKNLSVGSHTYIYNTTGCANYTAVASLDSESILIINSTVAELSQTYSTETYTSSIENFTINLSYDPNIYTTMNATFIYNGTSYSVSGYNTSAAVWAFNKSISVPGIPGNMSFYWAVQATNTSGSYLYVNSSTNYQLVIQSQLISVGSSCAAGLAEAFNFTFIDEETLTRMPSNVTYILRYGIGNTTALTTNGSLSNVYNFSICINGSLPTYSVGYGEIQYQTSNYEHRRFYIFSNTRLTNVTISNKLYSLLTSSATSFWLTVQDTSLNNYVGYYTSLLRWYPANNEYQIVEMGKTDDKGQTVYKVKTQDVDYRIGVYDVYGNLITLLNPVRMVCLSTPCTYNVIVTTESSDYTTFLQVYSNLSYDSTLKKFTYIWNDPSQDTSMMNLTVYKDTGLSSTIVCSSASSSFTGILTCDVSAQTGQMRAVVYRSASPPLQIAALWANIQQAITDITGGNTFILLLTLILLIFLTLVGAYVSPIIGIIFGVIAFIPAYMLGAVGFGVLIGVGALGGILIHFLKKT